MSGNEFLFLDEALENIPIKELFDFVRSYKIEVNIAEAENCLFEEFLRKNNPESIVGLDSINLSSAPRPIDFVEKYVEEKIIFTKDEIGLDEKLILESKNVVEDVDLKGTKGELGITDENAVDIDKDEDNYLQKVSTSENPKENLTVSYSKQVIEPQITNLQEESDLTSQNDSDDEYEYETIIKVTTIPRIKKKIVKTKTRRSSRFFHPKMSQMLRTSKFSSNSMTLEQLRFNKNYLEDLSADQINDFKSKLVRMKIEHIKSMNHFLVEFFEIELSIKELKNAKLAMDLCGDSEKSFFTFLKNLSQKCSNLLEKYRLGNSKFKTDLKEIQKRVRRNAEMSGVLMPVDFQLLNIEVQKSENLEKQKTYACYAHRFDQYKNKKKVATKKTKVLESKSKIHENYLEIKEQQRIIIDQKIENERLEFKVKSLEQKLNLNSYKLSKYSAPSAFQYILLSDTLRETDINLEKEKRLNRILKMKITNAKTKCYKMRKY